MPGPTSTTYHHPYIRMRRGGARLRAALAVLGALTVLAGCASTPDMDDDLPARGVQRQPGAEPAPRTPSPTDPSTGSASTFAALSDRTIGDCTIFPRDHVLNARNVDTLPKHPMSDAYVAFVGGSSARLKEPTSEEHGSRSGMPINVVDSTSTGRKNVLINTGYDSTSYTGRYPIPPNPRVEGHPHPQWDKHLLMLDVADCTGYELISYNVHLALLDVHAALAGSRYPLDSTDRPRMTTNVANTPMIGQYVMVDEVRSGSVPHPIAWCTNRTGAGVTWPANMSDGQNREPEAPPMGTWLRLRADVDLSRFGGQARPIADAMRHHGLVLTDTCGHPFSIMAENSSGWVRSDMNQLAALTIADFEAVDASLMKVSDNSLRIR